MMWIEALTADANVSPMARLTGIRIASRYLNNDSGKAWPSQETLAKDMAASVRSIRRWVDELAGLGYLARVTGGGRKSTVYELGVPATLEARARSLVSVPRSRLSGVSGHGCPPNPSNEPYELEPSSESESHSENLGGRAREKARTPSNPKTRMTDDWEPDEATCEAIENIGIDLLDLKPHIAEFRIHWLGVPGQAGMKANWGKTLINRVTTLIAWGKLRTREQKAAKVISFAERRQVLNPRGWYG